MGGFFGAVCKQDALTDVFFGTDYHSHLGTRRAGIAAYDKELGLQREIHRIENSPFRTKFDDIFDEMKGSSAIGIISDYDPQPLLIRSNIGTYAICMIGVINNSEELIKQYLSFGNGQNSVRVKLLKFQQIRLRFCQNREIKCACVLFFGRITVIRLLITRV